MRLKWKNGCAGTGVTLPIFARGTLDETYVKVNGRWAYLCRSRRQPGPHCRIFISPPVVTAKLHTGFWSKILNNVKKWQIPRFISTDKAPAYGRALALLKHEGRWPSDVEHRQIKYGTT
ncbi:transposase (plasmid) [Klebsiella pneumoniae]